MQQENILIGHPLDKLPSLQNPLTANLKQEKTQTNLKYHHLAISTKSTSQLINENLNEDPFFVCDLSSVISQYTTWVTLLPRIKPYYAIKCNPDEMIINTLSECGVGFDCASRGEIAQVLSCSRDIIYANPCKAPSHLKFASENGIQRMTFDNHDELYKIKRYAPGSKCILRVLTDDSKSTCRFGVKFGASLEIAPSLLILARDLGLDVVGVSFHVGSGCFDTSAFVDAVTIARKVFDIGLGLGFKFNLLDVGGGFPGKSVAGLQFEDIAKALGPAVDRLFSPEIDIIAEPGRYFVSAAFTLAVNIIARRVTVVDGEERYMYYINEGMYGVFNNITFDHAKVTLKPLMPRDATKLFKSSVWGPTCDSIDLILKETLLPELVVGDWLICEEMGAYTSAAASGFNGFSKSKVFYTLPK